MKVFYLFYLQVPERPNLFGHARGFRKRHELEYGQHGESRQWKYFAQINELAEKLSRGRAMQVTHFVKYTQ